MIPFIALGVATAFAADPEIVPNRGAIVEGSPAGAATAIQTAPKHPPRPPRARVSTAKKKRDEGTARTGGQMPPAGSAATGGTSASPGGAPTTPYGSPY